MAPSLILITLITYVNEIRKEKQCPTIRRMLLNLFFDIMKIEGVAYNVQLTSPRELSIIDINSLATQVEIESFNYSTLCEMKQIIRNMENKIWNKYIDTIVTKGYFTKQMFFFRTIFLSSRTFEDSKTLNCSRFSDIHKYFTVYYSEVDIPRSPNQQQEVSKEEVTLISHYLEGKALKIAKSSQAKSNSPSGSS